MRTRSRRRTSLIWLLLAVVLLLAVPACGGDDEPEGAGETLTGEEAEVGGDLSVVINWTGSELEAFQAVVDGFTEANPDVNVELVQIPFEELNAQLTQQFAAGSPPDVTVALPGLIRQLAAQDFLMPVDDLWDEWIEQGVYNESLRTIASTTEGTAYGTWFKGNVNALVWYKPAQLEELGIEPAETWEEFTAAADTAKAEGLEPFAVGGADQWPLTQWWDPILLRVGGVEAFNGLVDGTVSWDDPRVVESFELYGELIANYFPPNALDRGFIDATCAWAEGTAAFQNQGAFISLVAPGECNPDFVPGEDFTFFLMPAVDEAQPLPQAISGDLFAIAKDTDNPEAAKVLAAYLGSADAQAIWAERGGFIAPNADVPLDVYPNEVDRQAAELWPREEDALAGYDLDDFIGGEIQSTFREALQQFVRDQDVDRIVEAMTQVDTRAGG